jgi:protein-tyrosine phosphatase
MASLSSPYRIIAVCTGNICRSPMAELMLARVLEEQGLADAVVVDSAGTTSYEAGRPVDPRAARVLTAHKVPSHQHIARAWRNEWFSERHLILALDVDHYGWLRAAAPDEVARNRVRMLRGFDPVAAGRDVLEQGIEDPWYGYQSDFETTWELIRAAIPGILQYVRTQLPHEGYPEQQVRSIP